MNVPTSFTSLAPTQGKNGYHAVCVAARICAAATMLAVWSASDPGGPSES